MASPGWEVVGENGLYEGKGEITDYCGLWGREANRPEGHREVLIAGAWQELEGNLGLQEVCGGWRTD